MLRSVSVLVLDQLAVFEFGVLCEVFGLDRTDDGVPLLDFRVCGVRAGQPVTTTTGVQVIPEHGLDGLKGADLVAGTATRLREFPEEALQALRDASAAGATLLTVCSGVFVLGAAGLLDDRRVTAHWKSVDELRARHPKAVVDPDVLFVDDGNLITSAGRGGVAQRLQHLVGELAEPGGGNRDEVRTLQRVKPEGGDDLDSAGGGDRLPGTRAAHPEVEERDSVVRAIHPEDLAQHPELEHSQLVEDEDGDAAKHAGSVVAVS